VIRKAQEEAGGTCAKFGTTIIGGAFAASLLVSSAFAQTSPGTWNGLPDRFQIDTGYFRLSADTVLRYNGPAGGSGEIDFEQDLGLDEQVNTFWVDATKRVGRRHQPKLGFTGLTRDRGSYTLERDFTWSGETYNAGLTASSTAGSDILGGYANAWLAKRLVVHADYLYIKVNPEDSEASVTDWRLAADYFRFSSEAGRSSRGERDLLRDVGPHDRVELVVDLEEPHQLARRNGLRHPLRVGAPQLEARLVHRERLRQHRLRLRVGHARGAGHEVGHQPVGSQLDGPPLFLVVIVERPESLRLGVGQRQSTGNQDAALGLDRLARDVQGLLDGLGRCGRNGEEQEYGEGAGRALH
jgi:hypothetical protein